MTQQVGTGEWIDVMHLTPDNRKQRRHAQETVDALRALGLTALMNIENTNGDPHDQAL